MTLETIFTMQKNRQFMVNRAAILAQIGMDVEDLITSTLVLPSDQPCDPAEQTLKQPHQYDPNKTVKLPVVELVY